MNALRPKDFADWRRMSKALISRGVPPDEILWADATEELLFAQDDLATTRTREFSVPRKFVSAAVRASLHRDSGKWSTMYRVLWKLVNDSREVINHSTDPDVNSLNQMDGEVRRDCHKMKAFVRFRKDTDGGYVAWHEPSHLIVRAVAPFFARRFNTMRWAVLTPDCSAYWDQETLRFGPGVSRNRAPDADGLEELWKTYYANIFNPARVKISAMVSEMPKKYWHTMPETSIIQDLLLEAPERMKRMLDVEQRELPQQLIEEVFAEGGGLTELADRAASCHGCELCRLATQTVFGHGPSNARIVFVGEQPGDHEDRQGLPFVGPAGRLFRQCLQRVDLDPSSVYMTNTVKHFRWEPSPNGGKRRLHKRATWRQIEVCRPWVRAELQVLKPPVVVLLGATALQALIGSDAKIGQMRGRLLESDLARYVIATVHPSSLLRIKDNRLQQREVDKFCRELQVAADFSRKR